MNRMLLRPFQPTEQLRWLLLLARPLLMLFCSDAYSLPYTISLMADYTTARISTTPVMVHYQTQDPSDTGCKALKAYEDTSP